MTKIQKLFIAIALVTSYQLLVTSSAFATKLYFDSPQNEYGVGDTFQTEIKIDTEGQEINTAYIKFNFDSDILSFEDFSDGSSIINFWVEKPVFNNQAFSFAGIVPGGFRGKDGILLTIFLRAEKEGNATISFGGDSKVLLNDGKGTSAPLEISNFEFLISKNASSSMFQVSRDIDPPESFKPEIIQDSNVFDGQYFLVFATKDKGSGIDYYEVKELKMTNYELRNEEALDSVGYASAESPYLLNDQKLTSVIFVKAVDKQNNQIVEILLPQHKYMPWYKNARIWGIITLAILFVFALAIILWKIKKRKFSFG